SHRHAWSWLRTHLPTPWMALVALKSLAFHAEAPAGRAGQMPKISNPTNHMRPAGGGAFILPSVGWPPAIPCALTRTCPIVHQTPMRTKAAHDLGSRIDRGANSPSDCSARPVQSSVRLAMA